MIIRKLLTALSVVALLASAPTLALAEGEQAPAKKQSQVYKTGTGAAAGSSHNGMMGNITTGAIITAVAVATAIAIAVAASNDDDATITTTATTN